jgi:uncharacterized coiled-coil protein SlyX
MWRDIGLGDLEGAQVRACGRGMGAMKENFTDENMTEDQAMAFPIELNDLHSELASMAERVCGIDSELMTVIRSVAGLRVSAPDDMELETRPIFESLSDELTRIRSKNSFLPGACVQVVDTFLAIESSVEGLARRVFNQQNFIDQLSSRISEQNDLIERLSRRVSELETRQRRLADLGERWKMVLLNGQ